ncbi:MAG: hypothetical protein JWM45_1733 [Pseudonocardiales bacterium]|nr:hypothetical protein [Pseudonocardiales bacterium]
MISFDPVVRVLLGDDAVLGVSDLILMTSWIDLCPREKETAVKPAVAVSRATVGAGNTVSAMPLDRSLAARACSNEFLWWSYNSICVITAFCRASNGLCAELPRPSVASTLTRERVRYLMKNCVSHVVPGIQLG